MTVLYENDDFLILEKPPGWLSVPGKGPDKQDCLVNRLKTTYPGVLVVHRLDQATSGLMVFTLNKETQRFLGRQFEERRVVKEYEALLLGEIEKEGEITLRQRLDPENRPYQVVDRERGKPGTTAWLRTELLFRKGLTLSRVRFRPLTGRTHQLRLHARELGHPILGDRLYGPAGSDLEPRMYLHACSLEFDGPSGRVAFASAVPF